MKYRVSIKIIEVLVKYYYFLIFFDKLFDEVSVMWFFGVGLASLTESLIIIDWLFQFFHFSHWNLDCI